MIPHYYYLLKIINLSQIVNLFGNIILNGLSDFYAYLSHPSIIFGVNFLTILICSGFDSIFVDISHTFHVIPLTIFTF